MAGHQKHGEWYSTVKSLQKDLVADPGNLDLAKRIWSLLSGATGFDVRTGKLALETFRVAAFQTDEGLCALVTALRELGNDTGEMPTQSLIDPLLENRLRQHLAQKDTIHNDVAWILESVE